MADFDFDELMAENAADPLILFGRYNGKCASQIPVKYLRELAESDFITEDTRDQISKHLQTRSK